MKLRRLALRPYAIPLRNPFVTAHGRLTRRRGLHLILFTDAGPGYGEAAPLTGVSPDILAQARSALEAVVAAIADGLPDLPPAALLERLDTFTAESPAARFSLETALYDVAARTAGLPLARFLNPRALDHVPVNALYTPGATLPPDIPVLKLKVGLNPVAEERRRVRELLSTLPAGVCLRLDANGSWDMATARAFCRDLDPTAIDYLEQPLPAAAHADLAQLRRETEIPIAVDESLATLTDARALVAAGAADVFVIKPTTVGGFRAATALTDIAREAALRVVFTSTLETVVGRLAVLHGACANDITEACGLLTGGLLREPDTDPCRYASGRIYLPEGPGLGYGGLE